MDKAFLYIIFFFSWQFCFGQINLVHNGSFEMYSDCPTNYSQPGANQLFAIGWYAPTFATTDYYNACSASGAVSVPQSQLGYQDAHTGVAYTAIAYISGRGHTTGDVFYNYSEYLQCKLIAPLNEGRLYKIQLFVSRADSVNGATTPRYAGSAVDQIGVLFSQNPVWGPDSMFEELLPHIPSGESTPGILLIDTTKWQEVAIYYLAQGNEDYLTLGFFRDINSISASYYFHDFDTTDIIESYYFLDDISVMEIAKVEVSNIFTPNGDGTNDLLTVDLPKELSPAIIIYNRWGASMYENRNNPIGWDGTFRGTPCADGTYYYVLELEGTQIKQKGFIQLAR